MLISNNKARMNICNKILSANLKAKLSRDYVIYLMESFHIYQKKLNYILCTF